MSKETSVIVLGIAIIVIPYLGIPGSWRGALVLLAGIAVTLIGFLLRGEALSRISSESERRPLVERDASPLN